MINNRIRTQYPHQHSLIQTIQDSFYVADYTELTKLSQPKRSVEFFSPSPPVDISYFSVDNSINLTINAIEFDNASFVNAYGLIKSQCEAVFFPSDSDSNSWLLFCELKYSSRLANNENNLRKAIKQLYKSRYYYKQCNVFESTNTCYLIASLPIQPEPFANFSVPPAMLVKLKSTRNIVLRLTNSVSISSPTTIIV